MREQIRTADTGRLADIAAVRVDRNLPKNRRIAEFVRQMNGEPNHFMANGIEVISRHPKDAPPIEVFLKRIMA